mgnify:CR=1 FL=1
MEQLRSQTIIEIYVDTPYAHGNHTTVYNSYTKVITGDGVINKYGSTSACVKPIVRLKKDNYTCKGTGTRNDPYIVATK